jgi:trehalose 6-phosphate synthase/phosphatase
VTQTAQAFVTSFLTRCIRANSEHLQTDVSAVAKLDLARLLPRYKHTQRRLLLIEFERTLWQRDNSRAGLLSPFSPQQDVIDLLNKLAQDGKNEVWLLSGLPVNCMMEVVAEKVPEIGIV